MQVDIKFWLKNIMSIIKIYHNQRWSKSRESVKILENSEHEYEIVDYMNKPPTPKQLESLSRKMQISAREFIRCREAIFRDLNLKPHLDDDDILFKHMSKYPQLIERPIVVKGDKAVLGRPSERVCDLLDS